MPVTTEKVAMTHLPIHPFTGLTAIGFRRDGRPIFPILGGAQPPMPVPAPPSGDPAPAPTDPTPTAPPADPPEGKPLGPAGERALAAEREARKALEKQIAEFAPLKELAASLAGGQKPPPGKSEVDVLREQFAAHQKELAEERAARWRIEVAQAKNLTADQAAWLQGSTQEELAASADRLLAAFPTAPAGTRTPAPDPSQGARGGQPGPDLTAQIEAARTAGDFRKAISLERQKLLSIQRPS